MAIAAQQHAPPRVNRRIRRQRKVPPLRQLGPVVHDFVLVVALSEFHGEVSLYGTWHYEVIKLVMNTLPITIYLNQFSSNPSISSSFSMSLDLSNRLRNILARSEIAATLRHCTISSLP